MGGTKSEAYLKFFHKATDHSSTPFSFCNYCNRKGHSTSTCNAKKHGANSSYKWVPKGTKATKDPPPRINACFHKKSLPILPFVTLHINRKSLSLSLFHLHTFLTHKLSAYIHHIFFIFFILFFIFFIFFFAFHLI